MKLTDEQLKQLIQEEMQQPIDEGLWDQIKAGFGGAKDVAGIVPQALKSAGSAAMGALTGKEVSTPARKGGTFARGKATRLMTSHTKKMSKALRSFANELKDLHEDFLKDMVAMKLDKYKEIMEPTNILSSELKRIYRDQAPRMVRDLDTWVESALGFVEETELTKEPSPDAPPEDMSKRRFMGMPAGPTMAESTDDERQLKEHFKRYL